MHITEGTRLELAGLLSLPTEVSHGKECLFDPVVWVFYHIGEDREHHQQVASPKAYWEGFTLVIECRDVGKNAEGFELHDEGQVMWGARFAPYPEMDFDIHLDLTPAITCDAKWPGTEAFKGHPGPGAHYG